MCARVNRTVTISVHVTFSCRIPTASAVLLLQEVS